MKEGEDRTLGGYFHVHERPPAFEGADQCPYSVEIYVSDEAEPDGYGAALLFVRWSSGGDSATGHLETPYLFFDTSPEGARARIGRLSLVEVKGLLDAAIAEQRRRPEW
ncbi:MAG: hypothetical protein ACE5FJ_02190 [Gemmatimonadales bacterium]